jgi:hypothetical protein
MPKIKYVGLKTGPLGETAFSHDTNITWFPGTVKDVPQAIAGRMLRHPDVFALADPFQDEEDGDRSTPIVQPALAEQVQQQAGDGDDGDDSKELTEQQKRMAAFAAGDTGNENDLALGAGDQVVAAAGTGAIETATAAVGSADLAAAMTLAPGGTVQAPAPAPAPAAKATKAAKAKK